jgi:hypothetical protein
VADECTDWFRLLFSWPICYLVNRRCSLTGKDTRRNKLIDVDDTDTVSPLEMKRLFQSTTRQSSTVSIISFDALAFDVVTQGGQTKHLNKKTINLHIPSLGAGGLRVAQLVRMARVPSHWPFIPAIAFSASCGENQQRQPVTFAADT